MLISNTSTEYNHKHAIQDLLCLCKGKFIIVSPFLASEMNVFLDQFDFRNINEIDLITTFKPREVEQLTKPFQLKEFLGHFKSKYPTIKVSINVNNDLHGKLYIAKDHELKMILTSANFTQNGMMINHEWGVLISENEVIDNAIEDIYNNIDYPEISAHQIDKACAFATEYIKQNKPDPREKVVVVGDILESVYSDSDIKNTEPKYFLKPIGHSENPITLESERDFSELLQKLHFSKKMPKAVRKGDYIITTAVGAGSLLSYFKVTGSITKSTDEEIQNHAWIERWPWYVEARNHSTKFGKNWWKHNLRRQDLLKDFKSQFPNVAVTFAGGDGLGTINRGNDKVRLTKEFGEFLIKRIQELEPK